MAKSEMPVPRPALFETKEIEGILRERRWLEGEITPEIEEWMRDAASWFGEQTAENNKEAQHEREELAHLLGLIFSYDAAELLKIPENQSILSREGAREVIRELANLVLTRHQIDPQGFREIVDALKKKFGSQGRTIFYTLRLALAGKAGEGELDRVILLLDRAAKLLFRAPVKSTRQRMLEFCAAFR